VEGREQRSQTDKLRSILNTVDLDFFATAGVKLASGRAFTTADRATSAPVAVVNEKMQHDYWPGGALGRRVQLPGEKQARQIVGVARTANYSTWGEAPQLCVYIPLEQSYSDALTLYVRTKGDPHEAMVPVERELLAAGPGIMVADKRVGSDIIDGGLFQARVGVGLLTVFGLLALGLASIGLYGILAYSVHQRRREIGLRMALGATQGTVLGLILKEGMSLVLAGVAIGLGASLLVGRVLSGMLYGVSASDPLSVAGAAAMLSAVALVACFLPARWAARVDPLEALREG
jgi:predicted permease